MTEGIHLYCDPLRLPADVFDEGLKPNPRDVNAYVRARRCQRGTQSWSN